MKKWENPEIDVLQITQTANNIIYNEVEDDVKAGDYGDNPQGYICSVTCS